MTDAPPPPGDDPAPRRLGRGVALAIGAVFLLFIVGLAGYALAGRSDDDDGAAAEPTAAPATTTTTTEAPDPEADGQPDPPAHSVGDPYAPDSGATGYDATHYDIAFRYDPEAGTIDGVTTMTAVADVDLDQFSVDLLALDVSDVKVDGEPAEFDVDGRDVRIQPAAPIAEGEEFESEIAYVGVPEPVISAGFPTGWLTTDDGGAYVIGEPDGAATWFPSNDHPSDKATVDLEVTVPRGWTVAANGDFAGRERGGGDVTWTWQEDDPIATYLVTVAIDHFRMVEEETGSGLPLVSFYPEADADRLEGDFADADDMIEAFEEVFGPYPFDEYGAIVVPVDTGLALETQTRSTFGIDVAGIEQFRSHELAHQWFGDSLTPTRWSDIWLSEGFASYAEMLWFDASNPAYDIDVDAENRRDSIVGVDEEPILDPGVDRWFAEAVYQRGGLTLHALRKTVGEEDFFTILQRWTAEHEHQNVTTDEFIALAEEVSGQDLDAFFTDWLEADEIPALP